MTSTRYELIALLHVSQIQRISFAIEYVQLVVFEGFHGEDDNYKLMSGTRPFSGPPSLSQERIHGVTANLSRMCNLLIGILSRCR